MSFFDDHPEFATSAAQTKKVLPPCSQDALIGECEFCGAITDGVILGVCPDCAN